MAALLRDTNVRLTCDISPSSLALTTVYSQTWSYSTAPDYCMTVLSDPMSHWHTHQYLSITDVHHNLGFLTFHPPSLRPVLGPVPSDDPVTGGIIPNKALTPLVRRLLFMIPTALYHCSPFAVLVVDSDSLRVAITKRPVSKEVNCAHYNWPLG